MIERVPPAARLRIAVPAYTGHVTADTAHSLCEATKLLAQAGVDATFDFMCGCCYLDHTRNMLATRFMASDATDMLFVDADLGFAPEAAVEIAAATRPFVGGVYRKKKAEPEWPVLFEQDQIRAEPDGLVEAAMVPTGFLRLNRSVFEAMPAAQYRDDDGEDWRAWFRSGEWAGRYWGEDTAFCRDWRALGGKIYMLPELVFAHNGMTAFKGSWGEWMRQCR